MLDTKKRGKESYYSSEGGEAEGGEGGGGTSFKQFYDAPGEKCTPPCVVSLGAHSPGRVPGAKLTLLRLFEAIVLGQPLGVRHKHVVFELRVLLHQQERLTNRQVKGRGVWGEMGRGGEGERTEM